MKKFQANRVMQWAIRNEFKQTGRFKATSRITGRDYQAAWWEGKFLYLQASVPNEWQERKPELGYPVKLYGYGTLPDNSNLIDMV
jgi:hypothetical protein